MLRVWCVVYYIIQKIMEIIIGDIAVLKSGGPLMTVGAKSSSKERLCHWFVDGILHSGIFYIEELVIKKNDKSEELITG